MRSSLSISFLFQSILIFAFVSRLLPLILVVFLIGIFIVLANIDSFKMLEKDEMVFLAIFVISITCMTFFNSFISPITLFHFSISILTLIVAVVLTRSPEFFYLSSKWSLIIFQAIVISYVAFVGLDNYPIVVPLENMVKDSSANGITSYTVLLQLNYTIISYFLYKKLTFVTALATLFIALVSYGRGSIFASAMILLLLLATYIFKMKTKNILIFGMLFIGLIASTISVYSDEIFLFIEANTKLSAGIVDIQRSQIINEYFEKMDLKGFLFGVDYFGTSILHEFNSNPHNSFLRAHHIFGFPYLFIIVISPFYFVFNKARTVRDAFFYFFSIIILFFRIFSEPILFPTLFDFYFFAIIFFLAKNNINSRNFSQLSNG